MKQVAIYARVSSEQQAQQATVDSQVAALKERVESDGHVIMPQDVFVDEGFSGATLVRPSLERLRDQVAEGSIEILYVHSPDRLARKYAYQVLLLEEFRSCSVDVIFVHGPSGHSAEDELLVQVQGMISEYERAKILERCRRGKVHRARQGLINPLAGAPYGYLYIKKSDSAPAGYQVLLHEAKIVRSVFDALVHEQKSIGEIVRALNEKEIPTRRGAARWDRATVWGMLQNPAYMGKAAFGKTEATERGKLLRPVRGQSPTPKRPKSTHRDKPKDQWVYIDVPALVSADVFESAKVQLERNQKLSRRNARGKRYLLQGLTVCASCGYAFYGKTVSKSAAKGGLRYAYYRCVGTDAYRFAGGRICDNMQVRVDQLDGYVWESICALLKNPERMMDEWSRRQSDDGVSDELRRQRDETARMIGVQERSLQRLLDAYEAGAIDLADLTRRTERVRSRGDQARAELETIEAQLRETFELREVVTRLEDFATRVRSGLEGFSWLDRRQLIRTLVSRVEIDSEGATVVYRLRPNGASVSSPRSSSIGGSGNADPPTSFPLRKRGD